MIEEATQQLVAEGKYNEVLAMLSKQIEEYPNDDNAYYLRGTLYKQLGKWGESLSDLNKAIALNPDSKAVTLRQMLQEIVDFRYKDMLNP